MPIRSRFIAATKASFIHLLISAAVVAVAAVLIFLFWYPSPYQELSDGSTLFLLIAAVDVICGPLLTFILFNPRKRLSELVSDLILVCLIQIAALGYGLSVIWHARPLFLVLEVDRFKVVMAVDIDESAVTKLPNPIRPTFLSGPVLVAIREPANADERNKVLLEAASGGRDYGERAEFYIPYNNINAMKSLERAKPMTTFLKKYPDQIVRANELAAKQQSDVSMWMYLPVMARQDWVAVLDKQGQIQGFLKGDGF